MIIDRPYRKEDPRAWIGPTSQNPSKKPKNVYNLTIRSPKPGPMRPIWHVSYVVATVLKDLYMGIGKDTLGEF